MTQWPSTKARRNPGAPREHILPKMKSTSNGPQAEDSGPVFTGLLGQPPSPDVDQREFVKRMLACIELLCCEIGCDPAEMSDKEWRLLSKFAERFVPAFQASTTTKRKRHRGRPAGSASQSKKTQEAPKAGQPIDYEGYLRLLLGIGQKLNEGRPRWKSGLAKELAAQPYFRDRDLTSETIRKYLDQLLHATRDAAGGNITSFQCYFLKHVLPHI